MDLSNSKLLSLAIGVLGAVWCMAALVVSNMFRPALLFGGGLTCGLGTIALAILYLMVFRQSLGGQAAEVGAVPVCLTICYVVAGLGISTAFILRGLGGFHKLLMLCYAVISAVYLILVFYAEKDAWRLAHQLERTEQKTAGTAVISAKLGQLLSMAEDRALKQQLQKLKEAVDYSSNTTKDSTVEYERAMEYQLDELMELIAGHGEGPAIQGKLQEAETTWKMRSSAASSMR